MTNPVEGPGYIETVQDYPAQPLKKIIKLLEWQNELLQGLVAAQFEAQQREMEVLEKLLGEGGPSAAEESLGAMERMRTGALRDAMEKGPPS